MSLGRNENSDARARDENSKSANLNDKFLKVFRFVFKSLCDGAKDQIES